MSATRPLEIPRALARRAGRRVRLGQVDVRAHALPADRGGLVRLLPRLVADDENDQDATDDAFEVLHFIAGKRLDARAAHRRRRDERAARGARAARRAGARAPRAAGRDRARPARAALPGAQPRRGPTATSARTSIRNQRQPAAPVAARPASARASGTSHVLALAGGGRRGDDRARSRSGTTARDEHGPFDIIGDVHGCCDELEQLLGAARLRRRRRDRRRARVRHPEGRKARLRRRPRRPRAAHPRRRCGSSWQHGRARHGALRARQPRREARARAARAATCRSRTGSPSRSTELDASPTEFRQRGDESPLPRRPRQPLRPRRRAARRRARRDEGGDAGPRLGQGARLRAVRRDDRRDRRVRPAGALQLGRRVPRARRWSSTATRRCPSRSG